MDGMNRFEISDNELDSVVGGYEVGHLVPVKFERPSRCPGCGNLLQNSYITITEVCGEMNGVTVYRGKSRCCGATITFSDAVIGSWK